MYVCLLSQETIADLEENNVTLHNVVCHRVSKYINIKIRIFLHLFWTYVYFHYFYLFFGVRD